MPDFPDDHYDLVLKRLKAGMVGYIMGDGDEPRDDAPYSQDDVDRCLAIIDSYLASVPPDAGMSQEAIRSAVEKVVLELNSLNEKCEGSLIETDQREDLCQIILVAAREAGLDTNDDITEPWREW